ncbi:MAG TPA: glycoside hydrolase family 9 protein [Armatimonadota bacterium]|jgi:hypothetical protein
MDESKIEPGKPNSVTRRALLQGLGGAGLAFAVPPATPALADERSAGPSPPARKRPYIVIGLNQVGFLPADPKRAVIAATAPPPSPGFSIVDDAVVPRIRHRGKIVGMPQRVPADAPFQNFYAADFDAYTVPGRYRLRLADGRLSEPFTIGKDAYHQLIPLVLQYFDAQRCGRLPSLVHGPCHTDDGIAVGGPRDGQQIDATGGWHDAGDYLKFVETTSYVTGLLATTCERYLKMPPDPTSAQTLQALLLHCRVGLEWLLKMHPAAEEFYYQVGDESDHETWRLPETDVPAGNRAWKPRPVYFGVGANLAGRVAASLAVAARLYRTKDKAFAEKCLKAAETAFALGLANPKVVSTLPYDFYPEKTWADDMEWGAAQLFTTTGRQEYLRHALDFSEEAGPAGEAPSVYSTHAVAHTALYPHAPTGDRKRLLDYIRADAEVVSKQANNPYSLGTPLIWGTAEAAAGAGLLCWNYGKLSGDDAFLTLSRRQRDFILGCNPWGMSFVIGAGSHYPLNPHHQIADLKGVELTGALVGGPTSQSIFKEQKITLRDEGPGADAESPPLFPENADQPAVYHDSADDYVTNEPANDYTAKFLLLAALDAYAA